MKTYIKERTFLLANHTLQTGAPVRQTAKIFGLSKSTVHNDLSKRLKLLDVRKYHAVKNILSKNFSEKHIRGGMSTKNKFQSKNKK